MSAAYDTQHERKEAPDYEQEEREHKLLRMLKAEEEESLGYAESEITGQQIEALKRYNGEPYGDEEEGRSQVTTREVSEVIEWQRNDYARVFAGGGNVITLEETSESDEKYAKDAADYLQWIFFSDNEGFFNLDDFTFDGLLHRRGYLACYWSDKEYNAPQTLTGLNIAQVQELMADPQIEIIGQDFDNETEAGGISLVVKRVKSAARAVIESVAPEDMRLNGRAVALDGARYVGRVKRMLCGEAVRLWPDKRDDIIAACGKTSSPAGFSRRSEDVRQERFGDDSNDWFSSGNGAGQEVEVLEEYLRVDLDEDDYPELIRSYRIGDVLLEEGEVEENPFGSWTPIRIPHRFMGKGAYDMTADLQRQSTVITRAGLDSLYQAVVSREAYDATKMDERGEAAMLSTVAGTKIPVNGDPNNAIAQLSGGVDTTKVAWDALTVLRMRLEDRTGISRQTRGLDSDQLTKEHSGKALNTLQLSADARKEMTARNIAAGLGAFISKLYRLVCRHQNEPRQIKIGGKWCKFDPRTWNSNLRATVHVGGLNREHTLLGLQMISQEQDKVIETLGPANPMVTPRNRYRYQTELCRQVGWKDADAFFTEPPDQPEMDEQGQPVMDPETGQPKMKPWAPEPQKDPAIVKAEMDIQAKREDREAEKAQTQLQYDKDVSLAQVQQQDDMVRAQTEDADKARQHEMAMIEAEERLRGLEIDREIKLRELDLKKRELDIKERELDVRQQEAAAQREEAAADREHETEENAADRKADKAKMNGAAKE